MHLNVHVPVIQKKAENKNREVKRIHTHEILISSISILKCNAKDLFKSDTTQTD